MGILLERMREYFNPRSLAGATSDGSPADDAQGISIHAPSRERRPGAPHSIVPLPFQSTLPRGSDLRSLHLLIRHLLFQSTLPRGSDVTSRLEELGLKPISIHAPSRERRPEFLGSHSSMIFQSTLPRGSDCNHKAKAVQEQEFQSTLPRGSDGVSRARWQWTTIFQSTLPRGSDVKFHFLHLINNISIHAPSRERP